MFPFFVTGLQVATAMLALYALLGATSLWVKLAARRKARGMLNHQVNAWWRIFPVVSLALLAYPTGMLALAGLVFSLACIELESHYGGRRARFWIGTCTIGFGISWLGSQHPEFAPPLIAVAIAIQACHCWYQPKSSQIVWLLILMTAGAMYVLTVFCALPFGSRQNLAWIFYLFIMTALNDIGQFVAGTLFGQHKIAQNVSPNKTWEGLAGGIFTSQFVSAVLGAYLSLAGFLVLAIYALVLSIAGFTGDFIFSAAKRYLSIKDFSTLIPGHGGILDRVDSLVLTAPVLYCLLRIAE
ncbi:phosphatidate cytidylyltransferase [Massilia sp. H6]|uniref:phosphatidate cytidylyltransferase n=1 Tax=Massilia sp. H6 TaxID=2970464 RepID=UPI002169A5B3|nr:phosphatidate cytidylyltransferase [Massilia sp. H6]UVW27253.1 phosphatidate cytidylyltransferase [Massilia sp. H6]